MVMRPFDDVYIYILPKIDNYYMHRESMRRERENSSFFSSLCSHDRSSIEKKERENDLEYFDRE